MKKLLLAIALIFVVKQVSADELNYSAEKINKDLLENAHSVVREYNEVVSVFDEHSCTRNIKEVITVLDKNGDEDAVFKVGYDKGSKINIFSLTLYDKNGKKIRRVKDKEITDVLAFDGVSFVSDNRVKKFQPNYAEYPYTVEYEYEITENNFISSMWIPVSDYNISVERSFYQISYPESIKYMVKELHNPFSPIVFSSNGNKVYTYIGENIKALEKEPFSVSFSELIPSVELHPTIINYSGYKGNISNWVEYGKWFNQLFKDRDVLSIKEVEEIKTLINGKTDTTDIIKTLYEYMQSRTRYVGIQLGIGGYQPFPASSVYETGYGDCKALSNYMMALLKGVGIKSYTLHINAGEKRNVLKDFPNFQFNHQILCVPLKDTLWLECTSPYDPCGFLGNFTQDRDVVLLTENGGKLAHTKKYYMNDNQHIGKAEFFIDNMGNARFKLKTKYTGLQYDNHLAFIVYNYDERKKWLYSRSSLPSLKIDSFSYINNKKLIPELAISEYGSTNNYATTSGNYLVMPLNKLNCEGILPKLMKERKSDIYISHATIDYDTLVYHIPEEFKIDAMPAPKEISSDFGFYSCSASYSNNTLIYTRKYSCKDGHFPAADYKKFYDFVLAVSKADNMKVMLVKK